MTAVYVHAGLMILAALFFLAAVSVARRKVGQGWLRFHKAVTVIAAACAFAAAVVMFSFKQAQGYGHFSSVHSLVGLGGIILILLLPLAGVLMLRGFRGLRPVHRRAGHIMLFVLLIAGILGVMSIL